MNVARSLTDLDIEVENTVKVTVITGYWLQNYRANSTATVLMKFPKFPDCVSINVHGKED